MEHRIWAVVFGWVGVTYERNRFAGIAHRYAESGGLALRIIDLPKDLWTFETGTAVNQEQNTVALIRNFMALRFATVIRHNFTQTAFISESFESLPSVENRSDYRLNSESDLVAPLSGRLALKVSYVIRYQNLPTVVGAVKTDRTLSTGVQVAF